MANTLQCALFRICRRVAFRLWRPGHVESVFVAYKYVLSLQMPGSGVDCGWGSVFAAAIMLACKCVSNKAYIRCVCPPFIPAIGNYYYYYMLNGYTCWCVFLCRQCQAERDFACEWIPLRQRMRRKHKNKCRVVCADTKYIHGERCNSIERPPHSPLVAIVAVEIIR